MRRVFEKRGFKEACHVVRILLRKEAGKEMKMGKMVVAYAA